MNGLSPEPHPGVGHDTAEREIERILSKNQRTFHLFLAWVIFLAVLVLSALLLGN